MFGNGFAFNQHFLSTHYETHTPCQRGISGGVWKAESRPRNCRGTGENAGPREEVGAANAGLGVSEPRNGAITKASGSAEGMGLSLEGP